MEYRKKQKRIDRKVALEISSEPSKSAVHSTNPKSAVMNSKEITVLIDLENKIIRN